MKISKPEILLLEKMAKGNKTVKELAEALRKSEKQIYVTARKLAEKGFIRRLNGILEPERTVYIALLLQMMTKMPNLAPILSDSGIQILTATLKPVTIQEIIDETGLKRIAVYDKIWEAKRRSMVKKRGSTYELNERIWPEMKEFLEELKRYEATIDKRIPVSSIIYKKNDDEIVFSSREELDASKTAFSAYEEYGIKLLTATEYYYMPKRKLTKQDVLVHSLNVFEKDKDIRTLILVGLFYAKFKEEFRIKDPVLMNLSAVLAGGEIKGYPKYQEIKDRAEVYGIEM